MELINQLDIQFIQWLNSFARQNRSFDEAVVFFETLDVFKSVVLVPVLWALWFAKDDGPGQQRDARRELIIRIVIGAVVAIILTRISRYAVPFRPLPLGHPDFDFVHPFGLPVGPRNFWNSFPSDTTLFAAALSFGIFMISRTAGILAFLWTAIVIALPRMYLGFHFLVDILAGAAIGIFFVWLAMILPLPRFIFRGLFAWELRWPGLFYFITFICLFEFSTTFKNVQNINHYLTHKVGDGTKHVTWCARNLAEPKTERDRNFPTPDGVRGKRSPKALVDAARKEALEGRDEQAIGFAVACQSQNETSRRIIERDSAIVLDLLKQSR